MKTIADVIARMRALDAELPRDDGVAWFNRLYLSVTEAVDGEVRAGRFKNSAFLERLDVVFAEIYFQAVDAKGAKPRAWAPLFDARRRRDVAPIQFALCGLNAHINHDLPIALVRTAKLQKRDLKRRSSEHRDYEAVNQTLEATQEKVKHWFATGFTGVVDRKFGRVDDVVASWSIGRARDQAWTAAELLETLEPVKPLRDRYLLSLARLTGFAGRGLLVPTG